jgi:pilus assembly protein CpaC
MKRLFAGLTAALTIAAAAPPPALAAQQMAAEQVVNREIFVPKDKSLSFRLDEPATKIVVAQPDTAQVVAMSDRSFYVRGKELGATNLLVYGAGGRLMQVIDVRVGYDPTHLEADLAAALPGEHIHVRPLGAGVLLTGTASTTVVADRARRIAERYASVDDVTSAISVGAASQVVLEVRVLEADRSAVQDMGFNASVGNSSFNFSTGVGLIGADAPHGILSLTGHSGSTSIDVVLQALETKGLVRTLARPNLVAMSGEKASFIAGGEFPFPVPQGLNQVTIDFKPYGVKLDFQPVVEANGLIRLAVAPEVSQLDQSNSLRIAGFNIPALTIRRANTNVELKDGQSLAIGGLFQNQYTNALNQIPGLGDIPILGALFRSARWQKNETELVIVVTPHVVSAADYERAKVATVAGEAPGVLDLILGGLTEKKTTAAPAGGGK